jgi:putative addiction module component (TIGR02574 family)
MLLACLAALFLLESRGKQYTNRMTQEATELLKKALTLSPEERAQLVDSLLESLDGPREDPSAVEAAWNDEIRRRIEDLDSGKAKTVPWEEVRRRASAKLTDGR